MVVPWFQDQRGRYSDQRSEQGESLGGSGEWYWGRILLNPVASARSRLLGGGSGAVREF